MKKTYKYLSQIELKENGTSDVEVLRIGVIQDRGLKITKDMLEDYVKNFDNDIVGQRDEENKPELPVNMQHDRGAEAVGWIKGLRVKGNKLIAEVEWTEIGREKIVKKLFKFVSAEFAGQFPHHKTGKLIPNVFLGLALTNTPALKAQKPLMLSEELNKLINNIGMFKKYLDLLKTKEVVSKEEKTLLKEYLEELPEDEKTEEVKKDVADVEAKPEEEKKEEVEKTEEEKKAEADAKAKEEKEKEELKEKANKAETLEEKVQTQATELTELKQKQLVSELKEEVKTEMTLSEDKKVGFLEENISAVAEFMASLSSEQRATFREVVSKVRSVDLSEIGNSKAEKTKLEDKLKEAKQKAEKLSIETKQPLHECLAQVYTEMGLDKEEEESK